MLYMGVMMLIVLPLFLVVSARMIAQSSFKDKFVGVLLEIIFYGFAALSVIGLILLVIRIINGS